MQQVTERDGGDSRHGASRRGSGDPGAARRLTVAGDVIDDAAACYVVAECGHNHQGRVSTALEMIRVAKECGANAVKFQKRSNRTLFTRALYDMPYAHDNSYGPTYGAHREALEFGLPEYRELVDCARSLKITLFATAFDFESADFLAALEMPAFKISSADLTNTPLQRHVASFGKPVFLSTGGGTMDDVRRALDAILPVNPQLCVMQCTASYPVQNYEEMNLRVISAYREAFPGLVIGLSDHESNITMAVAAYLLGARVIEKHFTLNRAWPGTDHGFSLAPAGLQKMVRNLQRTRKALGDGVKRRYASEEKPLLKMGKKLVAARGLPRGRVLERGDVAIKSPGDGLPPYELENILGKRLGRPLEQDESILPADLEPPADTGQTGP